MSNEKVKIKKKFNIIDIIIIVLVILCVVGIYFRGQITEWIGIDKQLSEYKLTFKVSEIKYTSGEYFTGGTKVYLDSPKLELGVIDGNCTVLPAEVYLEKADGTVVRVDYPKDSYVDISGSIKCLGAEREDGFYLAGSYSITPGMTLKVHTDMLDFTITVTDITQYGA